MAARGITSISFLPDLGSTPATVNKRTGQLFISLRHWRKMTPQQRFFMLLHEAGHVTLQTSNEFEADRWAFEQYTSRGHSLKESVYALSKILSGRSPEHYHRVKAQLERALLHDQLNNPSNMETPMIHAPNAQTSGALWAKYEGQANEYEFGKGRERRQDRREQRQENKQERKMAKQERKTIRAEGRADKKRATGEANIILAEQGINARADMAKGILGGMAKVAGAVGGSIVGAKAVGALPSLLGGGGGSDAGGAITGGAGGLAENIMNTAPAVVGALGAKMLQPSQQEIVTQFPQPMTDPAFAARMASPDAMAAEEQKKAEEKKKNTLLLVGAAAVGVIILVLVMMRK